MTIREKAIQAIENCLDPTKGGCAGCPYAKMPRDTCVFQQQEDALEALRQSGAQLLALDDVPKRDGAVWIEFKVISGVSDQAGTWAFFVAEQRPNFNFQLQRDLQSLTRLPIDTYGFYWRCWSGRPTEKQREENAWR